MTRKREIMIGWVILGFSLVVQIVLLNHFRSMVYPDSPFRALALAFALSGVPGYAIVLSLHMWLNKTRLGFLHLLGGTLIWVGLLLFGLPLPGRRDILDVLAIALFIVGHPMVASLTMQLMLEDMKRWDNKNNK